MEPTRRDVACFEAGIKLGAVYHQFIGTPVRPGSAPGLARSMAAAMEAQPACREADVTLDIDRIEADQNRFGYTELAGRHMAVTVLIEHEGVDVRGELRDRDGYPHMHLIEIDEL